MTMFKKFLSTLTTAKTAFVSGDAAAAAAGAMYYVADSSGGVSDEEFETLVSMMRTNPRFAGLDVDALIGKWEQYASKRMMKRDLLTLLTNLSADKTQAEDILISVIEVADADGHIDEGEMGCIREVAQTLGLDFNKYL